MSKIFLPQSIFNKVMRAILEFDLIHEHDKILIGLSGGKDSLLLLLVLTLIRQRFCKNFSLGALHINPNFSHEKNYAQQFLPIEEFCKENQIQFFMHDVDLQSIIQENPQESPCFTCAFFRRGAINNIAKKFGYEKIAYAHHNDDAVETFLLSLFYSGQIHTFTPKTFLDRTNLTVIRPLVYLREQEIIEAKKNFPFEIVKSSCPYDGHTKRAAVKNLLAELSKENPALYEHLASAIHQDHLGELFPEKKSRQELKRLYFSWKNETQNESL